MTTENQTGTPQPPQPETAKPETATAKADKLALLKKKQEEIAEQIKKLEAKENSQKRKNENRVKILVGAAMLADINHTTKENPGAGEKQKKELLALLNRAIQSKTDREFLRSQGWLS